MIFMLLCSDDPLPYLSKVIALHVNNEPFFFLGKVVTKQ